MVTLQATVMLSSTLPKRLWVVQLKLSHLQVLKMVAREWFSCVEKYATRKIGCSAQRKLGSFESSLKFF